MALDNNISVIIPTCNRYDVLLRNVENFEKIKAKVKEILICDDSDKDYYKENSEKLAKLKSFTNVKYFYCARFDIDGNKDYGLARARNFGITNSTGGILVFMDDRLTPENRESLQLLTDQLINSIDKIWVFGNKGSDKKSFVENFSAIRKINIMRSGCFLERIDKYGGMTREIIARFTTQGYQFKYVPTAKAKELTKSSNWEEKDKQIIEMKDFMKRNNIC